MKKLGVAASIAVLIGAGLFFSGVLSPTETPKLQLQALLAANGENVTDRVDWFVERGGSWMGPEFETTTEAVPGDYTATFQILGGEDIIAELSLGESEGGTLLANLEATLVEVALPSDNRPPQVGFRFESPMSAGSHGVFVSEDGFARTLVSRDLSKLELETAGQAIPINADFASGGVLSLVFENGEVRSTRQ